jgi:sRNA-binding carbon storage regulator CsrA
MQVITRRVGDALRIADHVRVRIVGIENNRVRLSIDSDEELCLSVASDSQRLADTVPDLAASDCGGSSLA